MSKRQSSEWSDKYKDPRWQKKRLEILARDRWFCLGCGDKESTLEVHHGYYRNDAEGPWDYEDETLWTLCKTCHRSATDDIRALRKALGMWNPTALRYALLARLEDGAWGHQKDREAMNAGEPEDFFILDGEEG